MSLWVRTFKIDSGKMNETTPEQAKPVKTF